MKKLLILLLVCISYSSFATHGRCGYITIKQNGNSRTVLITVYMITNTVGTEVLFGGESDFLDFGDGSLPINVPEQPNLPLGDLIGGVAYAYYEVDHTYQSNGTYVVSYREPNRNAGILNIDNSVGTYIYFESGFTLGPNSANYESPRFLNYPIFYSSATSQFTGSVSAYDVNGHTLYYNEMTPKSDRGVDVVNYKRPENYNVNPHNGLITWDGTFEEMNRVGEFLTAIKIRQFDVYGVLVGYMNVDCQLIRTDTEDPGVIDDNRDLNSNSRIFTEEGSSSTIRVFAKEGGSEPSSMTVASELGEVEGAMSFSTYDSTSGDQKILVGLLTLNNLNTIARQTPYVIVVRTNFADHPLYKKDIAYTFYTSDTELAEAPEIKVAAESDLVAIDLSPNPSHGFLSLSGDLTEPVVVDFFTTSGLRVQSMPGKCGETVDISHFTPGLYIVIVKSENGIVRSRSKVIRD